MRHKYDYYICGPMRGYLDNNSDVFKWAANILRDRGLTVFNPAEENDDYLLFDVCMKKDLNAIINDCKRIVLLPGWRSSIGANAEVLVGMVCGKSIEEIQLDCIDAKNKNLRTKDITGELKFGLPFINKNISFKTMHY